MQFCIRDLWCQRRKKCRRFIARTFTLMCITSIFINLVWKMQEIFDFFTKIDDIVTQSKQIHIFLNIWSFCSFDSCGYAPFNIELENPTSQAIYTETGETIQKWTRISKYGLLVLLPGCVVVLPLLVNLKTFFTSDVGADAFELPLLMW